MFYVYKTNTSIIKKIKQFVLKIWTFSSINTWMSHLNKNIYPYSNLNSLKTCLTGVYNHFPDKNYTHLFRHDKSRRKVHIYRRYKTTKSIFGTMSNGEFIMPKAVNDRYTLWNVSGRHMYDVKPFRRLININTSSLLN